MTKRPPRVSSPRGRPPPAALPSQVNVFLLAAMLALPMAKEHGDESDGQPTSSIPWRSLANLALLLAFEVMLSLRMDHPDIGYPYSAALAPLVALLLPSLLGGSARLATGVWKRARASKEDAASLPALDTLLTTVASPILLVSATALVGLQLDGVVALSWWVVLSPLWLLVGLGARGAKRVQKMLGGATDRSEEEKAARKTAAVLLGASVCVLGTCLLLLCLLLGGQAHYGAAVVFTPLFAVLGLCLCCVCCAACCGPLVARAKQAQEEQERAAAAAAAAAAAGGSAGSTSGHGPSADVEAGASAGVDGSGTVSPEEDPSAPLIPGNTRGGKGAAKVTPVKAGVSDTVTLGQQLRGSGTPVPEGASGMSTKELKRELDARGVAHEHCLEKSELLDLLYATAAAPESLV